MKAIEIIIIPVTDQQEAKAFYHKLGFEVVIEAPADHGETWLQMRLPDGTATIALMSFHGIIIETADITRSIEEIKGKGIDIGAIDHKPWGKFAWLKDPDGNGLCLHEK
jgi:predicted enzyme related to lactoylglutathione lyase